MAQTVCEAVGNIASADNSEIYHKLPLWSLLFFDNRSPSEMALFAQNGLSSYSDLPDSNYISNPLSIVQHRMSKYIKNDYRKVAF